eukprot:gene20233-biopygen6597
MSGYVPGTHAKYPYLTDTGSQDRKSDWVQAGDPPWGRACAEKKPTRCDTRLAFDASRKALLRESVHNGFLPERSVELGFRDCSWARFIPAHRVPRQLLVLSGRGKKSLLGLPRSFKSKFFVKHSIRNDSMRKDDGIIVYSVLFFKKRCWLLMRTRLFS